MFGYKSLEKLGASSDSIEKAIGEAVDEWKHLEHQLYQAKLHYIVHGSQIYTNAFTRIILNFVGLHRQLIKCYEQVTNLKPENIDLNGFKDLLIIATSIFFELDRQKNIWRLDEFLGLRFVPICRKIGVIE